MTTPKTAAGKTIRFNKIAENTPTVKNMFNEIANKACNDLSRTAHQHRISLSIALYDALIARGKAEKSSNYMANAIARHVTRNIDAVQAAYLDELRKNPKYASVEFTSEYPKMLREEFNKKYAELCANEPTTRLHIGGKARRKAAQEAERQALRKQQGGFRIITIEQ